MSDRAAPIYIVCSPRPRSGKTFLARLLLDFLRLGHHRVAGFDVNSYDPVLHEFIPQARVIDIGDIRDQMDMFDALVGQPSVPKVVDLGHIAYGRFFDVAEEIGFVREARRSGIEPIILFAVDGHEASAQAFRTLRQRFDRLILVPVYNEAIADGPRYREHYLTGEETSVPLRIPLLAPGLKSYADMPIYSFGIFHETLPMDIPIGMAFEIRNWTRRAFLEFREMELRLLLRKLRASLATSLAAPDRRAS